MKPGWCGPRVAREVSWLVFLRPEVVVRVRAVIDDLQRLRGGYGSGKSHALDSLALSLAVRRALIYGDSEPWRTL